MKRIYFLFMLFLFTMASFAQMSHRFFNVTLGEATKQQVINALHANKVNIVANTNDGILAENVTHDGITYQNMTMTFYNGKLATIFFADEDGFGYSKTSKIVELYTRKYPSYRYYFNNSDWYNLDDDVMNIIISDNSVIFQDMKLDEQSKKDGEIRIREMYPHIQNRLPTEILGCKLGVSTKQQVINTLKSKRLRILVNNDANSVIFSGLKHEGVSFGVISANFFNGVLYSILFMHNNQNLSMSEMSILEKNLSAKYGYYDLKKVTGQNDLDGAKNYNDDRIMIGLMADCLGYVYWPLSQKKQRHDIRVLRGKRL